MRYYLLATHRYGYKSEAVLREIDEFARISNRYLHGIYTLTDKPFIDGLLSKLETTYK